MLFYAVTGSITRSYFATATAGTTTATGTAGTTTATGTAGTTTATGTAGRTTATGTAGTTILWTLCFVWVHTDTALSANTRLSTHYYIRTFSVCYQRIPKYTQRTTMYAPTHNTKSTQRTATCIRYAAHSSVQLADEKKYLNAIKTRAYYEHLETHAPPTITTTYAHH